MKLLIHDNKGQNGYSILEILDTNIVTEIKVLISQGKYSKAKAIAFTKGKFRGTLGEKYPPNIEAGMILSNGNLHRDLTLPR